MSAVLCCSVTSLNAFGSELEFHVVPSELANGLRQTSVWEVMQDNSGFLWVSNFAGLTLLSGEGQYEYTPNENPDSKYFLPSRRIFKIHQDNAERIWVITNDAGVYRSNHTNGGFDLIAQINDSTFPMDGLTSALVDSNNTLWLGHNSQGIRSINLDSKIAFTPENRHAGPEIVEIVEDGRGFIWFVRQDTTVLRYHHDQDGRFELLGPEICSNPSGVPLRAFNVSSESILIQFNTGKIFEISQKDFKCELLTIENAGPIANALINDMVNYGNNLQIFATDHGIMVYRGRNLIHHFHSENSSLNDNEIGTLSAPESGPIWIGTHNGLFKLIETPFKLYNQQKSGFSGPVVAFAESPLGLWVATYNGLYLRDSKSGQHASVRDLFPDADLTNKQIMSLAYRENNLWVGYRANGLEILNTTNGSVTRFSSNSSPPLSSDNITTIYPLGNNLTLIGTYGEGLNILDTTRGSIEHLNAEQGNGSISGNNVLAMTEFSAGKMLVGTEQGLNVLDLHTQRFSFDATSTTATPFETVQVWAITSDSTNNYWIGTRDSGLLRLYTPKDSQISLLLEKIQPSQEFPVHTVFSAQVDNQDYLWLTTHLGLCRAKLTADILHCYDAGHGLQGREFDYGASLKLRNGNLVFGGSSGYNEFNPEKIEEGADLLHLNFTEIQIRGSSRYNPLQMKNRKRIKYAYTDNVVAFFFSGMSNAGDTTKTFRYKLSELNEDWRISTGSATFTNLPPGTYTFEVQGANSAGTWNHDGATLDLIVHTPPWRTVWAYWIYAGMFLTFLWIMRRAYDAIGQVAHATEHAERMEETATLAMDQLQDQMQVQTDMADALQEYSELNINLIQNVLSYYSEKESESPTAQELRARCTLRLHTLHLLDSCIYHHGALLYVNMHDFSERVIDDLLERHGLDEEAVIVTNDVTGELFPAETGSLLALILYELLENCFQHAFHAQKTVNFIMLRLNKSGYDATDQPVFALEVADNGPGVHADEIPALMQGPGMRFVKSLAERIDASVHVDGNNGLDVEISRSV